MTIHCYISSNIGFDVLKVKEILDELDVEVIRTEYSGITLSDAIEKAISRSDFVLGILNSVGNNDGVFFELGFAKGLGKPVVAIIPPETKNLPQFLSDASLIRANLDDWNPIKYSLERSLPFLKKSKISKESSPRIKERYVKENISISEKVVASPHKEKPRQILGSRADEYIRKLNRESHREHDFLKIIESALKESGVTIFVESKYPHANNYPYIADLAIWNDELEPYISNPLLIEIKKKILPQQVELISKRFREYYEKGKSRWLLVLYFEGPNELKQNITTLGSQILFLKIEELLERMKTQSFAKVVRELRNYYVHGVGYGKI